MPLKGLEGKVAIVTGGAQGIGRATVERLLAEGANVIAVDRQQDVLEEFVATAGSTRLRGYTTDITSEDGCAAMVDFAVSEFGSLELLVNNAGVRGLAAPITELPVAEFEQVQSVNVRGVFLCLQAALRQMVKQGRGGSIVNLSSMNALRANPGRAAYNASKHAVIGLTMTAAVEYGNHGVRVNAIYPGSVQTGMSALADETRKAAGWRMDYTLRPIPRKASPSEIAAFIAWLLSEEASFQTGGAYTVDGGAMA